MKVLLINGSPKANGNTAIALEEMAAVFAAEGIDAEVLRRSQQNFMVTPRDIDAQVRDLAKVIGFGINWALQDLEIDEITALLS